MGRAPRVEYEGAVYHVMCRGTGGSRYPGNTSVRNAWIAEHLVMGNPSNLPRQVREVNHAEKGELFELQKMTK